MVRRLEVHITGEKKYERNLSLKRTENVNSFK